MPDHHHLADDDRPTRTSPAVGRDQLALLGVA